VVTAVAGTEWMNEARCRGMNPRLFFPEYDWHIDPSVVTACHECPVRDDCLGWALETNQEYGYWGGLTEEQRANINRTRSRVRCPDCRSDSIDRSGDDVEICLACGLSWMA
jgi:WhiB family transcriptional regulator, redox-sensing transcriptional regulator